ncbi:MAG: hemolysin family protein [Endomicrobiia bacterium]|nr:hemolysin family protein [Endomicrobiaceae bacterium]MDD5102469.1 hemolysin family protein [Endomicrobiaceae bacterium]
MFIFLGLIFLVIFFMLSAFWSASEIALNSLSKYRVKKLIVLKKTIAVPLLRWLDSPYYLLTVILTGNVVSDMMVSFLSTSLSESIFSMINRHILEFFTWIATTFVVLVVGEITPKIYSRSNSQKVALFAVPILAKIEVITKPFLYPILKILDIFFNKDEESKVYPTLSKDEVKALISEADKEGVFDKDISGMLERSVWFAETSVIKVMTPFSDIESVNINEEEEKFIDMVIETSRSRVPVYENKKTNIIGYIHINDILWIWKENNGKFSKSCIKPAFFIDQDKKISELLKELQSGRTHIAFVKDRKDNILGMVTLEDIVEEIVGEILDEYEL